MTPKRLFHVKHTAGGQLVHKEATEALNRLGLGDQVASADSLIHYLERVQSAGLNLVSTSDRSRLVERHLIPSLEALPWIPATGRLLDVGSGGGFPGIPIAWARPELDVILVESNARKAAFLRRVSRETQLANVQVIEGRIEALDSDETGQYDLITARAVTSAQEIITWTQLLLKPEGRWLLWKGRDWKQSDPIPVTLPHAAKREIVLQEEQPLSDGSVLLVLKFTGGVST